MVRWWLWLSGGKGDGEGVVEGGVRDRHISNENKSNQEDVLMKETKMVCW